MKLKKALLWVCALTAAALSAACNGDDDTPSPGPAPALAVVKPAAACASLTSVDLTDIGGVGSTITSATEGTQTLNGAQVKFCTVEGTMAPTVGFRVRLPVDTWTQRSIDLGCGGLCGSISAAVTPGTSFNCPLAQQGGFVLASTNMGHTNADATWAQDTQKRVDFAYRGVHITRLAAQKLTKAYYGQAEKFAYFVGCSDGGREGLMAAQRYPADYKGIVAGAPAFLFNFQNSLDHGWRARSNRDNGLTTGNIVIKPSRLPFIHAAVVAACDALDGQTDGLISDPRLCKFDPASIQCAAGATSTAACLTATEVTTLKRVLNGPTDPTTGKRVLVGTPQFGSELRWSQTWVPQTDTATTVGSDNFVAGARYLAFTDAVPPTLDEFQFTEAFANKLRARHSLMDATNPDLSAFRAAGGRLMLYHGWSDEHITPLGTIAYYEAMQKVMGQASMDTFMRMYLLPGVAHCGNGEGFPNVDMVTSIVDWTEGGLAPNSLVTYRTDATTSAVTASRPVYPYPALAKYSGTGDVNNAANYVSGPALYTSPVPDWTGADFYNPYTPAPL